MLRGIRLQSKISHIGATQKSLRNGEGCQKKEGTFKKGEWQSFEKKIVFWKIINSIYIYIFIYRQIDR